MPRKQFKADLEDASQAKHGVDSISDCRPGDDDGQVTFVFTHSTLLSPTTITAEVSEQSDYPNDHTYRLWCDEDAPRHVAAKIADLIPPTGKTITQLLSLVSESLSGSSTLPTNDLGDISDDDAPQGQDSDDDDYDDGDVYDGAFDDVSSQPAALSMPTLTRADPSNLFQSRIRKDLKTAKDAGFKISYFGGLLDGYKCVVSVSVSARKLGISEEAMQAWRIDPTDYIILLLQYTEGYKTKEDLASLGHNAAHKSLDMRMGASKHYKPTKEQVINAFAINPASATQGEHDQWVFRDTFMSKPLNNLMNARLVGLVRLRNSNMTWQGAEDFYRESQGMSFSARKVSGKHSKPEKPSDYPGIVNADHLADHKIKTHSFPLIAMQFMLRHFVRCTEFCLVCHKKLDTLVEAIKPYVCDSPLCLYQYMSLGFGPSIEHEILDQEKVVDLLVSFCYSSASLGRLRSFPTGLALSVPQSLITAVPELTRRSYAYMPGLPTTPALLTNTGRLQARVDTSKHEILFNEVKPGAPCPLKIGDWISIELLAEPGTPAFHCRVADTSLFPSIAIGPLISEKPQTQSKTATWSHALIDKYSVNFDDLQDAEKRGVVYRLLGLLPSVKEMKNYLASQHTPDLARWIDRISPAAFSVLRWTLASNRSCIMAVEDSEKAVHGMAGYMQFRFAMGAPDKEHRFIKAVKETSNRLKLKYPSMYAWHGSSVQNWHSIIREGLHFGEVLNGRTYGNGVYHAQQCNVSMGYSGMGHSTNSTSWPNSSLKVTSALALNEIVNAPAEFVSSSPYYVVSQLDWIQTRYLFVKCAADAADTDTDNPNVPMFDKQPTTKLNQDPARIPTGAAGVQIIIPATSSKSGKRKSTNVASPRAKKSNKTQESWWSGMTPANPIVDLTDDDDNLSVGTDDEDLEIFAESRSHMLAVRTGSPQTDFFPGSLDHDQLPRLPMPSYANIMATKRLSLDLQALIDVQSRTPLHELGWYIDPEKVENMYQWIVELHSFRAFNDGEKTLPLVTDMEKHKVKSIVLELRFPGSYPNNPPFIRVIRPRFLPFAHGGGGHVTAGGAICHAVLTSDGWLPTCTIESVLLQIRMAMASTEPKPARLQIRGTHAEGDANSYNSREAIDAYKRACEMHHWTIPSDFDQTVAG